ncbi:MAG: hypothetical protein JO332_12480 [Planctomycetaceae bacterium]|nr:hypothetical protein [Planctomycetaceae bacterium]
MDELTHNLTGHRRRIRLARAAEAALRWAFYASVAGCLASAASKFAGVPLPYARLAGLLAAAPLAMAVREWARRYSLRDCAIQLDRQLGLDERLSTAMEATGPLSPALKVDAAAAIGRSVVPARRYPREAALLGGTLLLAAALAVIPSPERSGARGDRALEEVSAEQAATLESLAKVDARFEELATDAARALKEGQPEQALALLEELRRRLAEHLLEGGGAKVEAEQKILDQVAASSAAVSAELARLGRVVHAPPPAVAQAKLERQKTAASAPASSAPAAAVPAAAAPLAQEIPWDSRYDSVVRKYRGY